MRQLGNGAKYENTYENGDLPHKCCENIVRMSEMFCSLAIYLRLFLIFTVIAVIPHIPIFTNSVRFQVKMVTKFDSTYWSLEVDCTHEQSLQTGVSNQTSGIEHQFTYQFHCHTTSLQLTIGLYLTIQPSLPYNLNPNLLQTNTSHRSLICCSYFSKCLFFSGGPLNSSNIVLF